MSDWDQAAWEKLSRATVKGAEYNSRQRLPHPKCLEGTRVGLLNHIYWLLDNPKKSQLIWLHGMAGVGKSAVAFTVAERMKGLKINEQTSSEKRLAGTFFFSRKYANRCMTGNLFATLVYQLACNFPSIKDNVTRAIRENPAILDLDTSLEDQMETLFLQPLRVLQLRLRGCLPLVFAVDALDECISEAEIADLISLLGQVLRDPDLPVTHILLTSRSEPHIRNAFEKEEVNPLVCEIPVKTSGSESVATLISLDGADVDEDICIYLQHSFKELRSRRPTFPQVKQDELARLANRAGRRFIVASTMMKFIDDGFNDPRARLKYMLELTNNLLPGTEVYKLYDLILSTCADPKRAYHHLSVVVALVDPLPISQISELLGPGEGQDVETALLQLRSVMDIPTDSSLPVNIYHSSVRDYASDPSNCSLSEVQCITPRHSLLAYSSFCLMIEYLPKGTAFLDALSGLERQNQAIKSEDCQNLKNTLDFMIQRPEPLQVLTSLLWLRGNRDPESHFWLESQDGHMWLQTQGGKDWLQTQGGKDWLESFDGHWWLLTQGGQDRLQTRGGKNRLQTRGEKDRLQTHAGQTWLQTHAGQAWLQTQAGQIWLQTQGGQIWLQTRGGKDWLQTWVGQIWLQTQVGKAWLQTWVGQIWLQTHAGKDWLQTHAGKDWLQTYAGKYWLQTQAGQAWQQTYAGPGQVWLQTKAGQIWLQTQQGKDWLQTQQGKDWLQTQQGREWLQTQQGKDWLQTQAVHVWLQTWGGQVWLQAHAGQNWLQTHVGQDWLQTQAGQDWLPTWAGQVWVQSNAGQVWLQTKGGEDWLQTQGGKNWLQSQAGKDWLQAQAGQVWQLTHAGKVWLQTKGGEDWLQTQGSEDWLQTQAGKLWLQTQAGQVWLQTQEGDDWLQAQGGKYWLQTQAGKEWLQTHAGQDWLQAHAGSFWLTVEEFSSTLGEINKDMVVPEVSLLPTFQAIQKFKGLPDFLIFPAFLALTCPDSDHLSYYHPSYYHPSYHDAPPQHTFPSNVETVHAMETFIDFAKGAHERSQCASDALNYACQNWAIHLSQAPDSRDDSGMLNNVFNAFWDCHLLSWLERQWCLKGLSSSCVILFEGLELTKKYPLARAQKHKASVQAITSDACWSERARH